MKEREHTQEIVDLNLFLCEVSNVNHYEHDKYMYMYVNITICTIYERKYVHMPFTL